MDISKFIGIGSAIATQNSCLRPLSRWPPNEETCIEGIWYGLMAVLASVSSFCYVQAMFKYCFFHPSVCQETHKHKMHITPTPLPTTKFCADQTPASHTEICQIIFFDRFLGSHKERVSRQTYSAYSNLLTDFTQSTFYDFCFPVEELCTLVITEALPEDSGIFKCIAGNQFGTISCSCFLKVRTGKTLHV